MFNVVDIFLPGLVVYKYKAEVRLSEFARGDIRPQVVTLPDQQVMKTAFTFMTLSGYDYIL